MLEVIIAINDKYGIGKDGKLPWHCPEDLKIFSQKTRNHIIIVGRKTAETLPKLVDRTVFVISKSDCKIDNNDPYFFKDVDTSIEYAKKVFPDKKIFIAGGAMLYESIFLHYQQYISKIHISRIKNSDECDTYFYIDKYIDVQKWTSDDIKGSGYFVHYVLEREKSSDEPYLYLLSNVMKEGEIRKTRNATTKSLFFKHLSFDLRDGFPLLTTKKMFFRGIVEELLFFLKGETNSKILEEKGVNIWKGNTSREFLDKSGMNNRKEGMMGPMYGYQWRNFNAPYDEEKGRGTEGFDQIKYVIDLIKTDPSSRRIIMTDYNPLQAKEGVLYPCHSILNQFYVSDKFLDMSVYNRSQDLFLGTPFNIASSALLLFIIAKMTNLTPRMLHMSLGDVHIYEQHYDAVFTQIRRNPFSFPKLKIKHIENIDNLSSSDFVIEDYNSHPSIAAPMIA